MGISPLDLQTMYSNMSNVAKTVANQQQGVQLAQQLQESRLIQQNMEKATQVKKAADNESKSTGINDEGHQKNEFYQGGGKKKNQEDKEMPSKPLEIRESYLGLHIDIER